MGLIVGFFVFVPLAVIGVGIGEQLTTGELTRTPLASVIEFLPVREPVGPAECNNVNPDCKAK